MRKMFLTYLSAIALTACGCTQPQQKPGLPESPSEAAETAPTTKLPSEERVKVKVDQLLKQLSSDEYKDRENAAYELKELVTEIPESIDPLIERYKETEDIEIKHRLGPVLAPYVKWSLTGAILRQFPDIVESLEAEDPEVRKRFVAELGNKKPEDAAGPLIKLLEDTESEVRQCAVAALGNVGGKVAIDALIRALRDEDGYVCQAASEALGRMGKPAAESLVDLLENKDENTEVRWLAGEALAVIGDERAVESLVRLFEYGHPVEESLKMLYAKGISKPFARLLEHADEHLHPLAAELLAEICDESADLQLIDALKAALGNKDEEVRNYAAKALGKIGNSSAVEPLIEKLWDEGCGVSDSAEEALVRIGEPAVAPLVASLKEKCECYPHYAVEPLVEIGEPAVEPLIEAFKDGNEQVREQAAEALGRIGDKKAVEPLIKALDDKAGWVRLRAAEALGEIGDRKAFEPLIKCLKSDDTWIRTTVVQALAKIGDTRAVKLLIEMLKDKDSMARLNVTEALKEITKQDFGEDYEKWKQWYEGTKNK